jgi:acetyltransferase/esterase
MRTQAVQAPGATLYTEVRGTGPALLLIPGGNGDAGFYAPLARAVADRFTVITYDRRGFSRSPVHQPVEERLRLQADGDDARHIVHQLAAAPAHVFGSSSGAIVALDLIIRYPHDVRTVVAHEPPVVTLLPDAARYLRFFDDVYDTYRRQGTRLAMREFVAEAGAGPPRFGTIEFWRMARMMARIRPNIRFWLEHELRQYTRYTPDVTALKAVSNRLVLAGGRESRGRFPYRPNAVLAERLGSEVVDLPGGHAGYWTDPARFAAELARVLV